MELVIPLQNMDFEFNGVRKYSPSVTAPSTPKPFGDCYYSAPSSPTRNSEFYSELDQEFYDIDIDFVIHGSPSHGAFKGEVNPETPRSSKGYIRSKDDQFAFNVSEKVEEDSISAEELFHGGMIKPSGVRLSETSNQKSKTRSSESDQRGRERVANLSSSSRRAARSLSPLRGYKSSEQEEKEAVIVVQNQKEPSTIEKSSSSSSNSSASSKSQKKWRFKDLFLFRNASEGRASDKDLLKRYTATMRANERPVLTSGSNSRRKAPPVSAHELLYTENRAAREVQKKKTFLPYKAGVWGGMPFNPALAKMA